MWYGDFCIKNLVVTEKTVFTKGEINRAGDALLIEVISSEKYQSAIDIINAWRASHGRPLQEIRDDLGRLAVRIDPSAIVAHRLKRLPSIHDKLKRLDRTLLSRMQDIGGCRAILVSTQAVYRLLEQYKEAESKSLPKAASLRKPVD